VTRRPINVVVPAALIEPILSRELGKLGENALTKLGRRVAAISGETVDGTTKRIRFVLRGQRPLLRASDADALVLGCGRFLELERVPHFPGSETAARQMVLDHEAATSERLTNPHRTRLAEVLWNFSGGFLSELATQPLAQAA
jgi:hypothetical protein